MLLHVHDVFGYILVHNTQGTQAAGANIHSTEWPEYRPRQRKPDMVFGSEPYADALIFEPLPYRSALKENCTHVIVLRTRSDNVRTTVKAGLIERTMTKRFFGNKQNLPSMVNWMHNQVHTSCFALLTFFFYFIFIFAVTMGV